MWALGSNLDYKSQRWGFWADKGKDVRESCKCSKNYTPLRVHVILTWPSCHRVLCLVCKKKKWAATMLLCDKCQHSWHMACIRPPLTSPPFAHWSCPCCGGSSVFGVSTNHIQWSSMIFTVLCMSKWKMKTYALETQSNMKRVELCNMGHYWNMLTRTKITIV